MTDMGDMRIQDERFLRLIMDHQNAIYAYILAMVHDGNDADDIMQETITLMWRKFDEFESGTNFTAWGLTVARFRVLKFFNENRSTRIHFKNTLTEKIAECAAVKVESMDERIKALKECVSKLAESDRQLLKMRYEEKVPTRKIADVVGISVHIMYRTMARIHKILQMCIRQKMMDMEI